MTKINFKEITVMWSKPFIDECTFALLKSRCVWPNVTSATRFDAVSRLALVANHVGRIRLALAALCIGCHSQGSTVSIPTTGETENHEACDCRATDMRSRTCPVVAQLVSVDAARDVRRRRRCIDDAVHSTITNLGNVDPGKT